MRNSPAPSAAAYARVSQLASASDIHMTPTGETDDLQEECDGWEETDYFQVVYGRPIRDIAEEEAAAQGITDGEVIHYCFYEELKDHFWEEWLEIHCVE